MELYQQFAKNIKENFFPDIKKGEFVSLIIDKQTISKLLQQPGVSLTDIARSINRNREYATESSDIELILSMVVLQLYAVSLMEDSYNYTVKAYYTHLDQVFGGESYQKWLVSNDYSQVTNQDKIWKKFYEWCDCNQFVIDTKDKLKPQPREKTRNTQYPLGLAKYTFNRKDLNDIASSFFRFGLLPDEDIAYNDFWRVIDIYRFSSLNSHITKVWNLLRTDKGNFDIAKSQIYNCFLDWDGSSSYSSKDVNQWKKSQKKLLYLCQLPLFQTGVN